MTTLSSLRKLSKLCWFRYCNVCESRVRWFRPLAARFTEQAKRYGHPYPPGAYETLNAGAYSCPHCGCSDRDRLCRFYLERLERSGAGLSELSFLDFAPMPRLRLSICHLFREYRSCDLLRQDVDDRVDITDMNNYPDGRWDAFLCSHVLEHVEDDRKALSELYRVLNPGGWGMLMVPINLRIHAMDEDPSLRDEAERWRRFGQDDHVRLYSRQGFLDRVEGAGFRVEALGVSEFGRFRFWRRGIAPGSVLYIVYREACKE